MIFACLQDVWNERGLFFFWDGFEQQAAVINSIGYSSYKAWGLRGPVWSSWSEFSWNMFLGTWEQRRWLGIVSMNLLMVKHAWPIWLPSTTKWPGLWMRGQQALSLTWALARFLTPSSTCIKDRMLKDGWVGKKFLDCCAQGIVANGSFSSWMQVRSGVLQGSSLRQILFKIFISILEKATECALSKSADDVKLQELGKHSRHAWPQGCLPGTWAGRTAWSDAGWRLLG